MIRSPLTWLRWLLALALGASLAWWGMILFTPLPMAAPVAVNLPGRTSVQPKDALALFGSPAVATTAPATAGPASLTVLGAVGTGGRGSVLLSLEGAPARAVRPGQEIGPGWRLLSIGPSSVELEQNGVRQTVPLPEHERRKGLSQAPANLN